MALQLKSWNANVRRCYALRLGGALQTEDGAHWRGGDHDDSVIGRRAMIFDSSR
jgi:hypothetical protein